MQQKYSKYFIYDLHPITTQRTHSALLKKNKEQIMEAPIMFLLNLVRMNLLVEIMLCIIKKSNSAVLTTLQEF